MDELAVGEYEPLGEEAELVDWPSMEYRALWMIAGLRWEYGPSCISAIVGSWGRGNKGEALETVLVVVN